MSTALSWILTAWTLLTTHSWAARHCLALAGSFPSSFKTIVWKICCECSAIETKRQREILLCEAKVVFALFCHLAVIYSCLIASTVCTLPACSFCLIQDDRKHHALSHSMLVNLCASYWSSQTEKFDQNFFEMSSFWFLDTLILPTVKAVTITHPIVDAGLGSIGRCARHSFLWKESWYWYITKKKHRMTITVREEKCQKYYRLWDTFLLRWMLPVMTGDGKGNCTVSCFKFL